MKLVVILASALLTAACANMSAEAPKLTLAMSLEGCIRLEEPGMMRCTYGYEIGATGGVYEGDLQVTDLGNAPVAAVQSSDPALQPSLTPTDQVCDVMAVENGPQVQAEMGHLGMNEAPTLYGWFCATIDPAATPPRDRTIRASAERPFRFTYSLDIDMSALAGGAYRNCAYLDWEGSGLTTPSQSPQACIDYNYARG